MRIGLVGRRQVLQVARRHATDAGVGVLFVGEPGVGKTRLLAETLALLDGLGWHTERFVASGATRHVPFGPMISLLPTDGVDRAQQITGVRHKLAERARGKPTAVAVDDAHLLDDATLACLVDLVHHSDVVVLGTARSTEPVPLDLTQLWASESLARIDVEPLDLAETTEFSALVLGGSVTTELAEHVWDRTRGVPLFIRELLFDALAQRQLVASKGTWHVERELRSGARLQELVGTRLSTLDDDGLRLIELLAVAEPLGLDLLDDAEGALLDTLEQFGMARAEQLAGQWVVRVDHPVMTEAIAATIPTRRRVGLLRAAADRTMAAGCPAPGDALKVARWRDECGDQVEPDVAIGAGREALLTLDLDRAVELAGLVLDERRLPGHLLLGEALRLQARAAEAERALAVAAGLADDDETKVRVAMWRSTLQAHHLHDPEGAVRLLDAAADSVDNPTRALELRSEAAFLAGILGRFDQAVAVNRQILATSDIDEPTRWTALMNLLFGQVMLADLEGIESPIEEMAAMTGDIENARPEGIDLYWGLRAATAMMKGELAECEQHLVAYVQQCIARDQLHGLTAAVLIYPLFYRGSPHALPIANASVDDLAKSDAYLVAPIAQGGQTLVCAGTGHIGSARAALTQVDDTHTGDLRLVSFVGRAHAAVAALEGRLDEAAEIAAAAGKQCVAATYTFMGIMALHDAVRYGRADLVADELVVATENAGPRLFRTMGAHAVAQRDRDGPALDRVASDAADMGANLIVVDALADASRVHSDEVASNRSATLAALWQRATPAPNALARPAVDALTERELDVVEHVLMGATSKAIAERLYLSVRTVDNHLAQVYRKLGVSGRDELRNLLHPTPGRPE